jgi:hypothetical protein
MENFYFGILVIDGKYYPVQVTPVTLNPMRCTITCCWDSKPERRLAIAFLFGILANTCSNEQPEKNIVFLKDVLTDKEVL